jgi:XTP/dITP diphosphohydrolase
MLEIVIATRNRHKVRELAGLLQVPGIRWRSLHEFPSIRSIPERGRTFDANAITKAQAVARATGLLALADDSGLEVDALGGRPGVQSARFAGRHGDDRANNAKLLRSLVGVPAARRGARYRCALALAGPSGLIALTRGVWRGRIASAPRGRLGFGYDPIVSIPRFGKTVGELPDALKARHSHRAAAARRLRPVLRRLSSRRRGAAGRARRVTARAA